MATLKAMFKLFDGYSRTADVIERKTGRATDKILKASGATDKFNRKLDQTGASAGRASSGIGKLVGSLISLAAAKKGMDLTDEYTNTATRLDLINDGLQTQVELQNKIYAAANRSRGAYSDMAGAISKMGLLAGDAFTSNDELIAFTELIQKGFKVGGASQSEQSSAMLQLTQAMAAGKLQGDEFRSIMENAPMIADAIAKFTGKSKGELKELSSEGLITSDIIKNAMFMAADDINAKFDKMPTTFGDVWNKVKNSATRAFAPVIKTVSDLINSDQFQVFLNNVAAGFNIVATAADWLIKTIVDNWPTISAILGLIATVYLVTILGKIIATTAALYAQASAWLAAYWPVLLVVGVVLLAIHVAREFGATWEEIIGATGGIIGAFATTVYNEFVKIWNQVAAFANFFGNVFNDPVAAVQTLFLDLAANVVGQIAVMAQNIEDLLNAIPGVKIDIASKLTGIEDNLRNKSSEIKSDKGLIEYVQSKEFLSYSEGYDIGSALGEKAYSTVSGIWEEIKTSLEGIEGMEGYDFDEFGTDSNPLVVTGKVDVNMSDEDLKYLRDIAERDYINKFKSTTLAPNVQITFGDVRETADVNELKGTLEKMMREEIATAAEGAY